MGKSKGKVTQTKNNDGTTTVQVGGKYAGKLPASNAVTPPTSSDLDSPSHPVTLDSTDPIVDYDATAAAYRELTPEPRQFPWPERPLIHDVSGVATHNHYSKSFLPLGQCPSCDQGYSNAEQRAFYGPNYDVVRRRRDGNVWKEEDRTGLGPNGIFNPVSPGAEIALPSGTLISSFNPNDTGYKTNSRRRTVTIHHASSGWIDTMNNSKKGSGYVILPTITWPGTGGYWQSVQLTPELCEANGIPLPRIPLEGVQEEHLELEPTYENSNRWSV